jgi:hypothetical protein
MSIGAALRHGPSIVPRIRVAARGRDRDVYRAGAEAESRRASDGGRGSRDCELRFRNRTLTVLESTCLRKFA